jgi:glycosyltransferase involved in cell wall biosynthesis
MAVTRRAVFTDPPISATPRGAERCRAPQITQRVTMLLENNPYPLDVRVRAEAESLVAAGHQVEVIAPRAKGEPAREMIRGVRVRRFRGWEARTGGPWAMLAEFVVASLALHAHAVRALVRGSSVLHLHNPPDILFPAGAMFRAAGRTVVFDHHDLGPELVAIRSSQGLLVGLARACERLTFAVASHVLAPNASHAQIARERGGKAAQEVTIVRNGPPRSWMEVPMRSSNDRLGVVHLAYVGAVAEQDGVEGLAAVLASLREHAPHLDVRLTVIGDGNARPALEAESLRYGVSERVTITGWVAPEAVPELLSEADVCVDPAPATPLNHRSTMMKVAEYLALGKPVVAYDLAETRATVGDAALLVPAGDVHQFARQIQRLAEDPQLRAGLALQGRERAAELTWDISAARLLTAYAGFGARTGPPGESA